MKEIVIVKPIAFSLSSTANLHYEKFSDGTIRCIEEEVPFKLPVGWVWSRGYSCFAGMKNKNPQGVDFEYIDIDSVDNKIHAVKIPKRLPTAQAPSRAKREVNEGSVLFSLVRPYLQNIAYISKELSHCIASTGFYVCNSNGSLLPEYMYYLMLSPYVINGLNQFMKGDNSPSIDKDRIENWLYPIPPLREQYKIVSVIQLSFLDIENITKEGSELKNLIVKIKTKILDLAIRGKLVQQDPNDEPASILLERIRKEKEELIKSGKLKRDKRESVIFRGDDNSYYLRTGKLVEPLTDWSFDDLPTNWEICCFGEICNYGDCINTESSVIENSAWILDLEDIEKDTGRIVSRVSKADRPSISTKHKFHKGQVLYSKLRPYLNKVVLADRDGYCTSEILPLEFHAEIIPEYARYYLMSPTFLRYADKCSYGVKMPRLGTNDGKIAIFPLPPVNEQKRIVKQIEFMFSHLSVIETSVQ